MPKGKLKVTNKLGGKIKVGRTQYTVPRHYNLAPREKYNNKECEFELEDGKVINLMVDGQPVPKDEAAIKRKAENKKRQAEQAAQEAANAQLAQASTAIFQNDSLDLPTILAPSDTREANIQGYLANNFYLKLNKLARFDQNDNKGFGKFKFYQKDRKKGNFEIVANFDGIPVAEIAKKQVQSATQLLGTNNIVSHKFEPNWRLIIGLGSHSVYETSMTLHHIYGIPFIPASGIKGVLRSWIIANELQWQQAGENPEGLALKDEGFCAIFGCPASLYDKSKRKTYPSYAKQAQQGNAIFFDAFPMSLDHKSVQTDVMNPHYGPHYAGKKPPTDFHNPIPVFFLTVQNTSFQFVTGTLQNKKITSGVFKGKTVLEVIKEQLPLALTQQGIGAKTAVGYGYMHENKQI